MDEKILFTDKQQTPNEVELQRAMGNFYVCSDYVQTWKFPGKKYSSFYPGNYAPTSIMNRSDTTGENLQEGVTRAMVSQNS
jgi:hypothetical protein